MSVEEQHNSRIKILNKKISDSIERRSIQKSYQLITALRSYLLQNEQGVAKNQPENLIHQHGDDKRVEIAMGPQIDDLPQGPGCFFFDSGARLSFGITVRKTPQGWRLVSYRFQFSFPDGHCPPFIRFDLNRDTGIEPSKETRAHMHVGLEQLRLPMFGLTPVEVFDRIFYVLAKCNCELCCNACSKKRWQGKKKLKRSYKPV